MRCSAIIEHVARKFLTGEYKRSIDAIFLAISQTWKENGKKRNGRKRRRSGERERNWKAASMLRRLSPNTRRENLWKWFYDRDITGILRTRILNSIFTALIFDRTRRMDCRLWILKRYVTTPWCRKNLGLTFTKITVLGQQPRPSNGQPYDLFHSNLVESKLSSDKRKKVFCWSPKGTSRSFRPPFMSI